MNPKYESSDAATRVYGPEPYLEGRIKTKSTRCSTRVTTHRTRLKSIVNPVLRAVQFWTDRPVVVGSAFKGGEWTGRYRMVRFCDRRLSNGSS